MQLSANRSVVIISGLLTLIVLGGGTLAVAFHNSWVRTASASLRPETAAATAQPATTIGLQVTVALPRVVDEHA
jgi:hypothetical protein